MHAQAAAACLITFVVGVLYDARAIDALKPLEDSKLTIDALVRKYGYPCEVYDLTTSDGYIVKVHRIPYGRRGRNATRLKASVILQHGLTGCATNFLFNGPDYSLGYVLADAGYDVWLPDSRGTYNSRRHVYYNPDFHADYWKFSFHEIGVYDLPTVIDFALNKTGHERLFHIGHSQGNTVFYAMAAARPEYNRKIMAHFSYAPSAFVRNVKIQILLLMAQFVDIIKEFVDTIGVHEFLPGNQILRFVASLYCADDEMNERVCSPLFQSYFGRNEKEFNRTMLQVAVGHVPGGASTYEVLHYGQMVKSGRFCQFDYGPADNLLHYNSTRPPDYNISQIDVPMYLFYSTADILSDARDVLDFNKLLPNSRALVAMDDDHWSHVDFIIARSAKAKVFDKTIAFMDEYVT